MQEDQAEAFSFCAGNDFLTVFPKTNLPDGKPGAPQTFRSWRTVIEEGAAAFDVRDVACNKRFVSKKDRRSKSQRWGRAIVLAKCRCSLASRAALPCAQMAIVT